jgi:hypothetical protein
MPSPGGARGRDRAGRLPPAGARGGRRPGDRRWSEPAVTLNGRRAAVGTEPSPPTLLKLEDS